MTDPASVTCNYTWQKSRSVFVTSLRKFCTRFSGSFVCRRWEFSAPKLRRIYLVKFSADHHNCQFSTPRCGAHFTCPNAAFALNQRINSLFGLCRWLTGYCAANNRCPLEKTATESNWGNVCGVLNTQTFHTSANLYRTAAFRGGNFNRHSLIRHFALLLCRKHVTDCSTDAPGRPR